MIKLITIFFVFLITTPAYFTQHILIHKKGIDNFSKLPFNSQIIKKNRVRSIQTEHMHKKELSPIVKDTNITTYYEFNNQGMLTMYYKTFLLYDSVFDTLVEFYTYTDTFFLKTLRRSEYGKFGVYDFFYENDKCSKLIQSTEENATQSKTQFIPKNHQEQYTEYYTYEKIDSNSYIKYTLSKDKIRFKEEEFIYKNEKLIQEQSRLLFSKQTHPVLRYYYFENDLVKKEIANYYSNTITAQYIYRYNSDKQLTSIQVYKTNLNEVLYLYEFLYDDNDLLTAILYKTEKTGAIDIIKYKYTFY